MRGDRSTVRAIRGPITLITVGVLFALQNFTPYGFQQTWPVLLIVFGLLSLMGRATGPEPPAPPPPSTGPQYNFPPAGTRPYTQTGYSQGPPVRNDPPSPASPGGAA